MPPKSSLLKPAPAAPQDTRPSRAQAEDAIRTILRYIGDDPRREGLLETPARVVRSYDEFFSGYGADPEKVLAKTFAETDGYHEMVILRDIRLESHCEHHMVPIVGKVHIGYLPHRRVVGISKLARVADLFARRLQIQEKLTVQIAKAIDRTLKPQGVGVVIAANHDCIATRGVHKPGCEMVTSCMLGAFRTDEKTREEFLALIGRG